MRENEIILKVDQAALLAKIFHPGLEPLPSQRTWLVFLHEALGCIKLWRDVPAKLAKATGCPALVFDRRGHGGSDPSVAPRQPDYLHEAALETLPSVLDQLHIDKAILVGHSDGGSIALIFAAEYPERVAGIISEAAHVFVEEETLAGIRQAAVTYRETALREKLMRYHGSRTDALFSAWQDVWLSSDFRDWQIETLLPRIQAPVLAIQGAADAYGTRAQVDAIQRGVAGPCEVMWVPDCGHEPHREAGETVLPRMATFIEKVLEHTHT